MFRLKTPLLAACTLVAASVAAQADPKVVVSIKPVHSLVSGVMEGVGTPELIVEGAGSPHTYALKPSKAKALADADVVFWMGPDLEAFLEKPIGTVASNAKSVALMNAHDLKKLPFREGGPFEAHGHEDHDDHKAAEKHDDHDHGAKKKAHAHDDHDHGAKKKADAHHDHDHGKKKQAKHDDHAHDHGKKEHAKHDDHAHDHGKKKHAKHDDHAHDHAHDHGEFDVHVWLDPQNAKALVHEIEEALAKADPANAAKYEANAKALMAKLDGLTKDVSKKLEGVKDKSFVVFHDAYQYFEDRFGVKAAGSITVSPEVIPGAKRVGEIRDKVKSLEVTCVFAEPQFEPKLVTTVTEGTKAKSGVLDPLGADLQNGPDLYFTLIRNMATSIRDCLSASS